MKAIRPLLVLVVAAPFVSPAAAADPKCFSANREGHCIVVRLNGQTSAKVSKKTKKVLKGLGALSFHGEETRYEIPTPVQGDIDLRADFTPESAAYFGPKAEIDAHVVTLEGQALDTSRAQTIDSTVQVSGGAAVKDENVMKENRLPAGKYLLTVKLRGASNWDRQVLFFEVTK